MAAARSLLAALLSAVLSTAAAAAEPRAATTGESPAPTHRPLRCEPPALGRDRLTVACELAASKPQRVRLRFHFTGSHDDTTASMQVAIGDAPVACDVGSKTSTEGEDGDVTLECRLTASGKPGASTLLRASAKWFHAQYVGVEVDEAPP